MLKKLENKGLLTRKRSESDERNLIVTLTAEGEALREKALHIPGTMSQCVNLNTDEIRTLYQLLNKLLEVVEKEK